MKLKVGMKASSEFCAGPVIAITKQWVIIQDNDCDEPSEYAVNIENDWIEIAVDELEEGGGKDELELS